MNQEEYCDAIRQLNANDHHLYSDSTSTTTTTTTGGAGGSGGDHVDSTAVSSATATAVVTGTTSRAPVDQVCSDQLL